MKKVIFVIALLALSSAPVYAKIFRVIDVPKGNVTALKAEIAAANELAETHETTLILSGDYRFGPDDVLPDIVATLGLRGAARLLGGGTSGVSYSGDGKGPSKLFIIRPGGFLRLDNIEIGDFSLNHEGEGLIVNRGTLHLEEVQIRNVNTVHFCVKWCTPSMTAIVNESGGEARFYRVSLINVGIAANDWVALVGFLLNRGDALITNSQLYLDNPDSRTSIRNDGTMQVHSSSFLYRDRGEVSAPPLFGGDNPGDLQVLNSLVAGFDGESCRFAHSVGYNLHDSPDCGWASKGDLVGIPAGVIWQPVNAHWLFSRDQNRILKNAIVPMAASPAVDSANDDWCVSASLLRDGRIRGEGCDRGAVETRKILLGEGGINGLFFNPDADGHYLQILQTDFLVLVVWNTFDLDGNHVWVYGTGELIDGRSVIAETYINNDVLVLPGQSAPDAETTYWGTLEVELTSCQSGHVSFNSVDPAFGSGQFPIERLASVKQLGCVD